MPDRTRIPRRQPGGLAILVLIGAVAALGASPCEGGDGGTDGGALKPGARIEAEVTDVVDGDTLEVELAGGATEDVRLIGVDTPETVAPDEPVGCFGPQASAFTKRELSGAAVELELGAEVRDPYDRLLAYVRDGDGRRLFNAELLRRGLAETLTIPPNDALAGRFDQIAARASETGRGLWGRC